MLFWTSKVRNSNCLNSVYSVRLENAASESDKK